MVTDAVHSVTVYAAAAYAAATWRTAPSERRIGRMTAQPTQQEPVTVRVFTRRFGSTPRGARLARHLAVATTTGCSSGSSGSASAASDGATGGMPSGGPGGPGGPGGMGGTTTEPGRGTGPGGGPCR